jgi:hypothetical protein
MRYDGGLMCLGVMLVAGTLVLGGCGRQGGETTSTTAATEESAGAGSGTDPAAARLTGPAGTVYVFLEGARSGDDDKVTSMLTPKARQELAKMQLWVAPPRSDTARFELGEIRYPGPDVAHVASVWTDVDPETGLSNQSVMTWVLRKEAEGWRVGGLAMEVFEGEPPLLLNFESPEDMLRQREQVKAEIARRTQQAQSPATMAEKPEDSSKR